MPRRNKELKETRKALKEESPKIGPQASSGIVFDDLIAEEEFSNDDEGGDESGSDSESLVLDKFGNSVSKGSATDPAVIKLRAEKASLRELKVSKGAADTEGCDHEGGSVLKGKDGKDIASILEKQKSGAKLSNKERKLLKKEEDRALRQQAQAREDSDPLRSFSLSMVPGKQTADSEDTASATDIIVHNFSISAPGRQLFTDASLKLVSGRHYGLLGPNGRYVQGERKQQKKG